MEGSMFEHWGRTIYWDSLSWEAFAAFAAFIAAGVVGWRQVGIARRQTDLLDLEVRTALWDRRMALYDTTREYLAHIVQKGRFPGRGSMFSKLSSRPVPGVPLALAFHQAVDRGQFLLSSESYARLLAVRDRSERLAEIHEDASALYEPEKTRLGLEAKTIRAALIENYNNVAEIFGRDLTLSNPQN